MKVEDFRFMGNEMVSESDVYAYEFQDDKHTYIIHTVDRGQNFTAYMSEKRTNYSVLPTIIYSVNCKSLSESVDALNKYIKKFINI